MTIFVELIGQLGNQMFQYAAAQAQADRLKERVVPFATSRRSELVQDFLGVSRPSIFSAFPNLGGQFDARVLSMRRCLRRDVKFPFGDLPVFSPVLDGDDQAESYTDAIWEIGGPVVLSGFFQSQKYWRDDASFVRQLFDMPAANKRAISMLESLPHNIDRFVAVHVRLTDYFSQSTQHAGEDGWVLSADYFSRALAPYDGVPIALFSDDIVAAEKFLPRPASWRSSARNATTDLAAMTMFSKIVISNSTFAWWAAMLNKTEAAEVTAPLHWIGWRNGVWFPRDIEVSGWRYV